MEDGFKALRELVGEVKELLLDQGKRNTPVSKPPLRNATNDRNVGKTTDSKKPTSHVRSCESQTTQRRVKNAVGIISYSYFPRPIISGVVMT